MIYIQNFLRNLCATMTKQEVQEKDNRRQDEVGTPYCITVDFDTLEDNTVTIRDRDTMEQIRININEIENWMKDKFEF